MKNSKRSFYELSKQEVLEWSEKFSYSKGSERIEKEIKANLKSRGYLTKEEFLYICNWKTDRSKSKVALNSEQLVEETSRIA